MCTQHIACAEIVLCINDTKDLPKKLPSSVTPCPTKGSSPKGSSN